MTDKQKVVRNLQAMHKALKFSGSEKDCYCTIIQSALDLIEHLALERDAAVLELGKQTGCITCAKRKPYANCMTDCLECEGAGCDCAVCVGLDKWEWNGLHLENVGGKRQMMAEWISVKDGLPKEHDSFFTRYYGTPKWDKAMFRKMSDAVLITIRDEHGDRAVAPAHTKDGSWSANILRVKPYEVTHWMPFPKPAKEDINADASPDNL